MIGVSRGHSGRSAGKDTVGPRLGRIPGRFYGSVFWRAEAIIAFTAFLKSARLLMAQ